MRLRVEGMKMMIFVSRAGWKSKLHQGVAFREGFPKEYLSWGFKDKHEKLRTK